MQNARVAGSKKLLLSFQRKDFEARQCAPERAIYKTESQAKSAVEILEDWRNVIIRNEKSQPKKGHMGYNQQQCCLAKCRANPLEFMSCHRLSCVLDMKLFVALLDFSLV